MNDADVLEWIACHLGEVESLLVEAARRAVDAVPNEVSDFEWHQSLEELAKLGSSEDCSYDRPTIGAQYLLWYQPRRVEGAVRTLAPVLCRSDGDITIADLGCGAGAGVWAVALIEAARRACGGPQRQVRVEAIDTSPFMLEVGRIAWVVLADWLRRSARDVNVEVEWIPQSWTTARVGDPSDRIVLASYVFDWSDRERAAELAARATELLDELSANHLILTCAASKRLVSGVIQGALIGSHGWADAGTTLARSPISRASIPALGALRRAHLRARGCTSTRLDMDPAWHLEESVVASLTRVSAPTALPLSPVSESERFVLDRAQDAAAEPDGRMTAVLGAAGSGKSRVLIERLARTVERRMQGREPVRILVTAFNKALIEQLGLWLRDRLAQSGRDFDTKIGPDGTFAVGSPGRVEVVGMNWDKVARRYFGVTTGGGGSFTARYVSEVAARDEEVATLLNARPELLEPRFLDEELARVVYGLRASERDSYREVTRTGRSIRLMRSMRDPLYTVLMGSSAPRTFTHVRIDAHRQVIDGAVPVERPFDFIAIDEYQDFTLADFDLVSALVLDGQGILVAGDPAQALHLGATSGLPGSLSHPSWPSGRRWNAHRLEGSYRMPVRICEAVEPLARSIHLRRETVRQRPLTVGAPSPDVPGGDLLPDDEIVFPVSVKNAVLGVRPIIVAGNKARVRQDVQDVLSLYRPFMEVAGGAGAVTVAEGDGWIEAALKDHVPTGFTLRRESMLKIKGLERPCVVWSTRASIPEDEALEEWVYTILTRSTCLVVIALSERAPARVREVVTRLRRDRLLFWSKAAEHQFDGWCGRADQGTSTISA